MNYGDLKTKIAYKCAYICIYWVIKSINDFITVLISNKGSWKKIPAKMSPEKKSPVAFIGSTYYIIL